MITTRKTSTHTAIEMDDGKVNAMSHEMLVALTSAIEETKGTEKPVLIKGRKGIFSAGFDMPTFARGPEATRKMVTAGVELIGRILSHPAPVVTLCTGHAYPMGAFILMASDHAFAIEGAFQIGMNETAISIEVPDFAMALARGRLNPSGLKGVLCARMHSPKQALATGYIDTLLQPAEEETALSATLEAYAKLNMKCFASTKSRANAPLIEAIGTAGLPARLTG